LGVHSLTCVPAWGAAAYRLKSLEVDAFGKTQAHQQIFVGGFRFAQILFGLKPMTRSLDRFAPCLRRFDGAERAALAVDRDARMRASADSGIIVPAPINQIVTRLRSRPRVVRDLVGRQPGSVAHLLRQQIEL